jgi:hypothetical protein
VPHGTVTKHRFADSRVFPNTARAYWVYVPAQYSAEKPAALMVFFDGGSYVDTKGPQRVPVVFDNLIAKGDMPVTVAVLINPGGHPDQQPADGKWKADNRSFEYDTLSDANAPLRHRRNPARSREDGQADARSRRPRDLRRVIGRDRGVDGGVGAAGQFSQGALAHRQLHIHRVSAGR